MSDLVIDASLTLQWFLEDEAGREYGLAILRGLADKRAVVPPLWVLRGRQRSRHGLSLIHI